MKNSRDAEEQVAYTLRLAESARRSPTCAGRCALPKRRSTFGRRSTGSLGAAEVAVSVYRATDSALLDPPYLESDLGNQEELSANSALARAPPRLLRLAASR